MNAVGRNLGKTAGQASGRAAPGRIARAAAGAPRMSAHHGARSDRAARLAAVILSLAWCAALVAAWRSGLPGGAAVLMGGWTLGVLPVHCAGPTRAS